MSAFEDFRLERCTQILHESDNVQRVIDFCLQYLLEYAPEALKGDPPTFEEMVQILRDEYECGVTPVEDIEYGCQPS